MCLQRLVVDGVDVVDDVDDGVGVDDGADRGMLSSSDSSASAEASVLQALHTFSSTSP